MSVQGQTEKGAAGLRVHAATAQVCARERSSAAFSAITNWFCPEAVTAAAQGEEQAQFRVCLILGAGKREHWALALLPSAFYCGTATLNVNFQYKCHLFQCSHVPRCPMHSASTDLYGNIRSQIRKLIQLS